MKAVPNELGRAAVSTQGRDKGRIYVVVGVLDERTVLVTDGKARTFDHPKKKQLKHLRGLPERMESIAQALTLGKRVMDEDIRKALPHQPEDRHRGDANKEECALVQK